MLCVHYISFTHVYLAIQILGKDLVVVLNKVDQVVDTESQTKQQQIEKCALLPPKKYSCYISVQPLN